VRIGAALVALWATILSAPGSTYADGPRRRVAIITKLTGPPDQILSEQALFAAIADVCAMRIGIDVASYNELYAESAEETVTRAANCGSDLRCASDVLARAGYGLAIRAVVTPPRAVIELIDPAASRRIASSSFDVPAGDPLREIRTNAQRLLDGAGLEEGGCIQVRTNPADADVVLIKGPVNDPGRPKQFTVRAGHYTVHAEREGFLPKDVLVAVIARQIAPVAIDLEKEPGDSFLSSRWFWLTAASAVIAGTGTAIFLTTYKGPIGGIEFSLERKAK
jgi:hypothetical protein